MLLAMMAPITCRGTRTMLNKENVINGMQVRHMVSGELFTVVGVPFWFDCELTVTLHDAKGGTRMSRLANLEDANKNVEGDTNE